MLVRFLIILGLYIGLFVRADVQTGNGCCTVGGATYSAPIIDTSAPIWRNQDDTVISLALAQLAGFDCEVSGKAAPVVPATIRELDGKQVRLVGFMMPIEYRGDKVASFMLVESQLACCYGKQPRVNEWVHVRCQNPVLPSTEVPVAVTGSFHVNPEVKEGKLVGLYGLDAISLENL